MDDQKYVNRLQRQVNRNAKEILVTGSTRREVERLSQLCPPNYMASKIAHSQATGDFYQWWWLNFVDDGSVKFSATRKGLIPMSRPL